MKVNYKSGKLPKDYKCTKCGVHGVKLWREFQTSDPELHCYVCAEARGRKNHLEDPDWKSPFTLGEGDQISWMVPCVPDEQGVGYWGYSSVPEDGCAWWKNLPLTLEKS